MAGRKARPEMSGIFDFLKRGKKKAEEERGLTLPEASIFEVFQPGERPTLPAPRPEPPERRLPGILRMFEAFAPAPAAPPPPTTLPAVPPPPPPMAPAVWERLFGPPAVEPERPVAEMFVPPPAAPPVPVPEPAFFAPAPEERREPKYTFLRIPRLTVGPWRTPSAPEFAAHLSQHFVLDQIFREVENLRRMPGWRETLETLWLSGQPIVIPLDPVVTRNIFTDFARLFNIPWNVVEGFIGEPESQEELDAVTKAFLDQIVAPMMKILTAAFDLLKPKDISGWFTIGYDHRNETWYLFYVEPLLSPYVPVLPPGIPQQGGLSA